MKRHQCIEQTQRTDGDQSQSGEIQPGRVFTARMPLDDAAEAYRAMDERRAIKTLLRV